LTVGRRVRNPSKGISSQPLFYPGMQGVPRHIYGGCQGSESCTTVRKGGSVHSGKSTSPSRSMVRQSTASRPPRSRRRVPSATIPADPNLPLIFEPGRCRSRDRWQSVQNTQSCANTPRQNAHTSSRLPAGAQRKAPRIPCSRRSPPRSQLCAHVPRFSTMIKNNHRAQGQMNKISRNTARLTRR
jgi:hypothetical protein